MFISLKLVIFLKNKIFSVKDHVLNDKLIIKTQIIAFQTGAAYTLSVKQIIRNCIIFHWYYFVKHCVQV